MHPAKDGVRLFSQRGRTHDRSHEANRRPYYNSQFVYPPAWFGNGWCRQLWQKAGGRSTSSSTPKSGGGEDGIFRRSNEWLADLSVGGAFMQGAGTTRGSILNLRFKLPGSDDFITATAITRHTRNSGFGVEFLDLSSDNVKRLATFIDENS